MRMRIEEVVALLVAVAMVAFASGALVAREMGEPRRVTVLARAEPEAGNERTTRVDSGETRGDGMARVMARVEPGEKRGAVRYLVRRGDTLWDIAARHYDDAAEAMERIKRRNRLDRENVLAGETLVLPGRGRR